MGANGASGDYNLENSLRFRSSASAYLSRTPTVAGNRKTWTWSAWVKLGTLTGTRTLFGASTGGYTNGYFNLFVNGNNVVEYDVTTLSDSSDRVIRSTTAVLRDPSAWYHIVLKYDVTQATDTNRVLLYVNGESVIFTTAGAGTYPALNTDGPVNSTIQHQLGIRNVDNDRYYDGYLTEVNFVDGQALTPSDFGEYNEDTGVWQPIKYTGTYGTNGFYLPFNDASSVAALGFDNSGNSNNWTPNNISVYGGTSTSFSTVGTTSWTAPAGVTSIKYLVVAGGGGGGSATTGVNMGGGGGAGGLLQGTLAVTPGNSYTVTIGSGGAANTNGGDSVLGTITATGGGYGARNVVGSTAPSNGGSGGGASAYASNPGSGIAGQGFSGGTSAGSNTAAGGGGSSEVGGSVSGGTVGGKGGDGTNLSISGSSVTYAGGGGGGAYSGETGGAGGSGGGGAGGSNATDGANATGYGSGGGGAGQYGNTRIGGSGSSGIVVISYGNSSTYDSMTDVPTLTDEDTANYATFNPLETVRYGTMSDGNLRVTATTTDLTDYATIFVPSGKYYVEFNLITRGSTDNTGTGKGPVYSVVNTAKTVLSGMNPNGTNQVTGGAFGSPTADGNIIGLALNHDVGEVEYFINNVSQGTQTYTSTDSVTFKIGTRSNPTTPQVAVNFGQRPFTYTPPTGYLKLNTFNLPDSSIVDGSEHFGVGLWTGTGSVTAPNIPSVTNLKFKPEFLWSKSRSTVANNYLYDIVRSPGDSPNKFIGSNTTDGTQTFNAFTLADTGFTLATTNAFFNQASATYVAWNWKAGGTAVPNTAGTLASQVSANTTAGFSIVTFTGTQTNQTVGHGLGVPPEIIITKPTVVQNWVVGATSIGWTKYLHLNLTNAEGTSASPWNNTAPTSYVYSVGIAPDTNNNGNTMVAYCFASVEGYSKIGSYTGNGSADGPFVYTGFKPAFIMFRSTSLCNWVIVDSARSTYNVMDDSLYPNTNGTEITTITDVDFLSNGFKWRANLPNETNASGQTYIYMAFAENPFKNSLAR